MKKLLLKFHSERRGAIVLIFAICLVPLVLLVALAIDYDFYTEAESQIQLAADAAATHAVRAATGTYALEINNPLTAATAAGDAVTAGQEAGLNWFNAQLGSLPTASVPTTPVVTVTATTNPAGFSAAVQFTGKYPPFFNNLFNRTSAWNITGTSGAAAQYSYVQIMMMLDTSQSMDIGANLKDMQTMQENSVCVPNAELTNSTDLNSMYYYGWKYLYTPAPVSTTYANDDLYNVNFKLVNPTYYNYPASPNTDMYGTVIGSNGTCKSGTNSITSQLKSTNFQANQPLAPCALACHTTSSMYQGQPSDLYGLARRETNSDGTPVQLRIDELFSATENVIQTMIATQQASNQFSVGLYQFNDDISVLANGTQGTPGNGDASYEATYNLPSVLQGIESIDYTKTPSETSFPPTVNAANTNDYTNFPLSVTDFVNGTATNGQPLKAVVNSGSNVPGYTASNPVKDVFIITDGMEDSSPVSPVLRQMGEMTGKLAENNQTVSAVCNKFKSLGYTVFVLYIDYYPLPLSFYTSEADDPATAYTQTDYPSFAATELPQGYAEGQEWDAASAGSTTPSPNQEAMEACASVNPNDPPPTGTDPDSNHYYYEAKTSDDINTELSAILTSALSSAIRLTQ